MGQLVGFGSPIVTVIWALSFVTVAGWLIYQLVMRHLVTVPSTVVLFTFFIPIIAQYPFAWSAVNGITIGVDNYARYRSHVDAAFLITMVGMAMVIVGYVVCGRRQPDYAPMTFLASGLRAWSQSLFLYLSSLLILLLFALLLALGLLGAAGARDIAQSLPALRPFYNIVHFLLPLTIVLDLLVGAGRRRRSILVLAIVNLALAVLTGSRAVALGGLLLFALVVLAHASLLRRLTVTRVLKLFPVAIAALIAAVYLADVRQGQYNILFTVANLGLKIFYGNNFSDLRDFAWVKSYWNGEYYLGKTQAAGFLAFIPSAISPFRAQWNWGVVTTTTTGLDPQVTPGLRAGPFGEMYFNFGWIGVVLAGLVYGYVVRRVHNATLTAVHRHSTQEARLQILAGFVTVNLAASLLNTSGFYGSYITVAIIVGLHALDYLLRAIRSDGTRVLGSRSVSDAMPS
jgi:oligosaccharide repeat unit polymerase